MFNLLEQLTNLYLLLKIRQIYDLRSAIDKQIGIEYL